MAQVVPGAFVIILAQDATAYWTFSLRGASLWLARVVHMSQGCCKLHYFARCRQVPFPLSLLASVFASLLIYKSECDKINDVIVIILLLCTSQPVYLTAMFEGQVG